MTHYLLLIPANEFKPAERHEFNPNDPGLLGWLQQKVGGFIEVLTVDTWHAFFNEDGKSHGLPINRRATHFLEQYGLQFTVHGQYLVGDVICLGHNEEGDERTLPEETFHSYETTIGPISKDNSHDGHTHAGSERR